MLRLAALGLFVGLALATCEWTDDGPVLVDAEREIYQFHLRLPNGTLWQAFPMGGKGGLELVFAEPSYGYRVMCSPDGEPQFKDDYFARIHWVDLPPLESPTGWDLCTYVGADAPLEAVRVVINDGCDITPSASPTPAPTSHRASLDSLLNFLLHRVPIWAWVCIGVILGSLTLLFASCCACSRSSRTSDVMRSHYTPLEDHEPPSPPREARDTLPESLAPNRLMSPFRAFMGMRCGSLFCLVLSARKEDTVLVEAERLNALNAGL